MQVPAGDVSDPLEAFAPESSASEVIRESDVRPEGHPRAARWWGSRDRKIALAAALIAVVEAAFLLRGAIFTPAASSSEGLLRVASSVEGTQVVVDGFITGRAPFELPLRPGPHHVKVRHAGLVREFTADIRPGAESNHHVEFSSDASPVGAAEVAPTAGPAAGIDISSEPPGARVLVDGKQRGVTPLRVSDLAPGDHEVVLANATGSVRRRVTLAPAVSASLVISMPAANATASGWVKLDSPLVAQIYEGRELLGTTEVGRLMLPAGRHTLRLVNASVNLEQEQVVDIVAGQTRAVTIPLPSGLVSINAIPWARVWIDGKEHGETPIGNLAIPVGPHEVVLKHPQLGEQRRTLTVTLGGVTRMGVDLRR